MGSGTEHCRSMVTLPAQVSTTCADCCSPSASAACDRDVRRLDTAVRPWRSGGRPRAAAALRNDDAAAPGTAQPSPWLWSGTSKFPPPLLRLRRSGVPNVLLLHLPTLLWLSLLQPAASLLVDTRLPYVGLPESGSGLQCPWPSSSACLLGSHAGRWLLHCSSRPLLYCRGCAACGELLSPVGLSTGLSAHGAGGRRELWELSSRP